jgi:hypothetical protein
VISPAPREAWWRIVGSSDDVTAFQTPAWLDCVCEAGWEDASRLYDLDGGRQLVLPLVRRRRLPQAMRVEASLPDGWGYGGIVASDRPVDARDVGLVLADVSRSAALRTSLKAGPLAADSWRAAAPADLAPIPHVVHVLDLAGGFTRVWEDRFTNARRRGVRKAERAGLEIESGNSERLVQAFCDVYGLWLDRRARERRKPPLHLAARWLEERREPRHRVRLVAERLNEACRVWVAWLDGAPAAAIVVHHQGPHAFYWRGAMVKELAAPTRASELLQRLAIEDAIDAGCRYYHMGESGGVASLIEFKERFGARAVEYPEYRIERLPLTSSVDRVRSFRARESRQRRRLSDRATR